MPPGRLAGAKPGRKGWQLAAAEAAGREDARRHDERVRAESAARQEAAAAKAAAELAEDNAAGRYRLRNPYGRSYFGSGGAYGSVKCGDNCRTAGRGDDGFIAFPTEVLVVDRSLPASFSAKGGDCIGRDGREWGEAANWSPAEQRWCPVAR